MQARLGDVKLLRRDDVVSQVEEATSTTLITTTDEETVCLSKLQQTLGSGNTRDSHIETQNMLVEMDELIAGLGKWQQQRQLVNMETAHIDSSSPITTHGAEPTDDDTITNDSGILERGSSESESRDVVEIPEKPSSAREHLRMVESNRNKNSFTLDENLLKQLTSEAKRSLDDADNKLKSLQRETAELQLEEWRASVLYDQSIDEHPQVKDTEELSWGLENLKDDLEAFTGQLDFLLNSIDDQPSNLSSANNNDDTTDCANATTNNNSESDTSLSSPSTAVSAARTPKVSLNSTHGILVEQVLDSRQED